MLEEAVRRTAGSAGATASAEAVAAGKALRANRVTLANNRIDAGVTGFFLLLAAAIVGLSVREWWLLLSGRRPRVLHETEPVWLPDYAVAEGRAGGITTAGAAALGLVLARELTGEAQFERERAMAAAVVADCGCREGVGPGRDGLAGAAADRQRWERFLEDRYRNVRRCC